jgi:KUP system potassium uptake protein
VVYGDIGTSPLYALRECFEHSHIALNETNVLGVLSLIFWALFIIICIKYMVYVLRADNRGEGGILSLMALALAKLGQEKSTTHVHGQSQNQGNKSESFSLNRRMILMALGVFGAALLYGDGVITPAISVLSAVEGIKIITPVFEHYVIPITCIIIFILFLFQYHGTGKIGAVFGPIIMIWFLFIGGLGVHGILQNPSVIWALSPISAIHFLLENGWVGFFILGSVFLVVTGGEALYADMGHFGRQPIRLAWFTVAMPSLVLNYFGQGALLLSDPTAIKNPFYLLAPDWALVPLVIIATMATVIASQALISGVFSLTKQAVQLGLCPRISIIHTSSREIGQVYIPFVNWSLLVGVLWLVLSFKTSSNLAAAYGIAVTATMVITTILAIEVARTHWNWNWTAIGIVFGFFLLIDISFFATNIVKVTEGGWVPLVIGATIYLLMTTWQKGRRILAERLKARSMPVEDFIKQIKANPPLKVSGAALYMTSDSWGVPIPLLHNLKHNKVLHERIAILTIKTQEVPYIAKKERIKIEELCPGFYRIVAYYGFMEIPKIKHILEACKQEHINFSVSDTTFVLGRETILPTGDPNMSIWRESLFAVMARNATRPTAFFKIPPNQVIEVGIQVEI